MPTHLANDPLVEVLDYLGRERREKAESPKSAVEPAHEPTTKADPDPAVGPPLAKRDDEPGGGDTQQLTLF